MRFLHHICFFTVLIGFAAPAMAENKSPYKGGMNHTAISNPSFKDEEEPKAKDKKGAEEETGDEEAENESTNRIWNKYKSLAEGKAEEDEDTGAEDSEDVADEKSDKKDKTAQAEPAKPTGFAAIIDKYHENKAKQSQLRTINIKQPEPDTEESKTLATDAEEKPADEKENTEEEKLEKKAEAEIDDKSAEDNKKKKAN